MNDKANAEIAAADLRAKLIRQLSQLSAAEADALTKFLEQAESDDLSHARRAIILWAKVDRDSRAEVAASLRRVFGA